MHTVLFETNREKLLPFTHTRATADIRCGILTMRERWERLLEANTATLTVPYIQPVYGEIPAGDDYLLVNGNVFGTKQLAEAVKMLATGQKLVNGDTIIAARYHQTDMLVVTEGAGELETVLYDDAVKALRHVWDIFSYNGSAIRDDFQLLTAGRTSQPIPAGVTVAGQDQVFLEEGAIINPGCIINATTGPVYIGRSAELLEGVLVRGPLAVGEKAAIKMGAKVYADTTIGPGCKVGGEISNVVFFANSNKGHDGFLGNSVVGEWCNLGADTNSSNLKNNYDQVKIWDEQQDKLIKTGLTFCGLLMGDHSKCGINTMFNTGTVVGVSCNIYGGGFPEKFIPSFSWGGSDGFVTYAFDKAMETTNRMMERRGKQLTEGEVQMLHSLFQSNTNQRDVHHMKGKSAE